MAVRRVVAGALAVALWAGVLSPASAQDEADREAAEAAFLSEPGDAAGAPDDSFFVRPGPVSLDDLAQDHVPVVSDEAPAVALPVPGLEGEAERGPRREALPAPGRLDPGAGVVVAFDDLGRGEAPVSIGVEVLDAEAAGVGTSPLVWRVDDPSSGVVTVSYGAFADAGGWGFWDRARVRVFPACVTERPDDVLCSTPVELVPELVARDLEAETLTFRLDGAVELVEASREDLATRLAADPLDWSIPLLTPDLQEDAVDRNTTAAEDTAALDDETPLPEEPVDAPPTTSTTVPSTTVPEATVAPTTTAPEPEADEPGTSAPDSTVPSSSTVPAEDDGEADAGSPSTTLPLEGSDTSTTTTSSVPDASGSESEELVPATTTSLEPDESGSEAEDSSGDDALAPAAEEGLAPVGPSAGGGVILAMMSGSSGSESGDFAQVPRPQLGEWSSSPGSGNFGWSLPIPLPDVAGSLLPDLRLTYASSAVDMHVPSENGQSPEVGLGWDFPIGSIRRAYWACGDDAGSPSAPDAQLCWHSDNATIVLNGQSSELVKIADHASGEVTQWLLKDDPGWNVYRYSGSYGAVPSSAHQFDDNDDEYWAVAAPDGTRYFFGRYNQHYNSTLTVPVFASGSEPCAGGFGFCWQAYEWKLDAITDPHGNWVTFSYEGKANYYNGGTSEPIKYDRDARISRIEYGKTTSAPSSSAAVRIDFPERMRSAGGVNYWPEDLNCESSGSCSNVSPTFWQDTRLGEIQINVQDPSGPGYTLVDKYVLNHSWTHHSTETLDRMLLGTLDYIPTGDSGSSPSTITNGFWYTPLANRAMPPAGYPTGVTPLNLYRLSWIIDAYMGSNTVVTYYQERPCQSGQFGDPPNPLWSANTNDCFPIWVVPSSGSPGFNAFNKWLVQTVTEAPAAAESEAVLTTYDYDRSDNLVSNAGAGWTKQDLAWVPDSRESWSVWRGYLDATVTVGNTTDERQRTDYIVHRGRGGNLPGTSVPDPEVLAGRVRGVWRSESTNNTFDPAEWTTTGYQLLTIGASTFVNPQVTDTWRERSTGGTWQSRVTQTVTNRQVSAIVTEPNLADNSLDTCRNFNNRQYATWQYGARFFHGTVNSKLFEGTTCTGTQIGQTATWYDGDTTWGGALDQDTKLEVTRHARYDNLNVAASTYATYDSYGRIDTSTDARGTVTDLTYVTSEGFTTKITTALDPAGLNHVSSVEVSRARGAVTKSTDVSGNVTTFAHDRLGRVVEVNNAASTAQEVKITYDENLNGTWFTRVKTETLHRGTSTYVDTYEFYDGLGRLRQSFADDDPASNNGNFTGTIMTAVNYDSAGRVEFQTEPYLHVSTSNTAVVVNLSSLPLVYRPDYDGLGRTVATRRLNNGAVVASATSVVDADKVIETSMAGDTLTTTYDPRGLVLSINDGATNPQYTYDRLGRVLTIDDSSQRTNVDYAYKFWSSSTFGTPSWLGREYWVNDTDRGRTWYENDVNGNLVRTLDANLNRIRTSYDRADRPSQQWDENVGNSIGNGRFSAWFYDAAGADGLLDREESYTSHGTFIRDVLTRDAVDRVESVRWTLPTIAGFAASYDFGYTYNAGGSVATRTYPAGMGMPAETVDYTYDNAGRLKKLIGDNTYASDTYVASVTYDYVGRVVTRTHGQGGNIITRLMPHDPYTGWLEQIQLTTSSGQAAPNNVSTLQHEIYSYDADGSLTGITRGSGTVLVNTECFDNDNAGRLINNWRANGTDCWNGQNRIVNGFDDQYVYNTASVLTEVNDLTTPSGTNDTTYNYGTTTPGTNDDHQPHSITIGTTTTDTFTYEPNGDLATHNSGTTTRTHNYDALNRLTSVTINGDTTEFAYDPGGQRLYTEEPDGTIRIYLDDTEMALAGGWLPAQIRQYNAEGVQFATRNSLLSEVQYTFGNHQGSSSIIVDDNPSTTPAAPAFQIRSYDPYGEQRTHWPINNPQSQHNHQRFLNQYHDTTTDLAYLNARYYNPTTRLFTQPDPLRQETRPQATNAYSYALNNPNNLTDETGLCAGISTGLSATQEALCSALIGVLYDLATNGVSYELDVGVVSQCGYWETGCGRNDYIATLEFDNAFGWPITVYTDVFSRSDGAGDDHMYVDQYIGDVWEPTIFDWIGVGFEGCLIFFCVAGYVDGGGRGYLGIGTGPKLSGDLSLTVRDPEDYTRPESTSVSAGGSVGPFGLGAACEGSPNIVGCSFDEVPSLSLNPSDWGARGSTLGISGSVGFSHYWWWEFEVDPPEAGG